jgi:hypothetical protein
MRRPYKCVVHTNASSIQMRRPPKSIVNQNRTAFIEWSRNHFYNYKQVNWDPWVGRRWFPFGFGRRSLLCGFNSQAIVIDLPSALNHSPRRRINSQQEMIWDKDASNWKRIPF